MKKFISMLAAVAMMATLFVVPVSAATSANPIVNVYVEAYDGTDAPANYKPGSYDVYKVSYTTEGVDTSVDKMTALQIKFTIDDDTKIAEKSWQNSKTSGPAAQKDANGIKSATVAPTLISKGYYAWTVVDGIDAYDWTTYPDGGTEETLPLVETLIYVTADESVTFTFGGSKMIVNTYDDDNERTFTSALVFKVNGTASNTATLGGSSKVDVTSVTISGATNATVGDSVPLSATVEPNNATNPAVTWTKVSGDGAVSASGVVTANSAGNIVVKATADGVDSANYTVSFAAAETFIDPVDDKVDAQDKGTTALTDLQGNPVNEFKKNYGIAKFDTAITTGTKNYFIVATDDKTEPETHEFAVDFAEIGVEAENATVSFFAIVKSATHKIVDVALKVVDK